MKKRTMFASMLASLALFISFPLSAFAATTTVNSVDDPDWTKFTRDTGTIDITDEFGAPAEFGNGALVIKTPAGNDKAYLRYDTQSTELLSDLTTLTYYAYRDMSSTAIPGAAPALNVEIDLDGEGEGTETTTLVYEPIYQAAGATAVVPGEWQLWDAGADDSRWWSTNAISVAPNRDTFVPLSDIKAAYPDATVINYAVNQGGGNPGLYGGADALTVNETTYDFEPAVKLANKDQCKNDGWRRSTDPTFKNQGECVSSFASNKNNSKPASNSVGERVREFFRSVF